jgi:sensor domain CHASE-containing protein
MTIHFNQVWAHAALPLAILANVTSVVAIFIILRLRRKMDHLVEQLVPRKEL